jgi:hypothetical protein
MPRGYRYIAIAFVGIITATIAGLSLQPEKPNLFGNASYQEQQAGYRAGGSKCEPSAIGTLSGRERVRRADACAEAEENHRNNADNLIQYRRAADAADASAVLAYQQTKIGAWGVALGIVTMFAAIAAAWYARDAAQQGKRAADTADKAFAELERPHLFVDSVTTSTPITRDWYKHDPDRFFDVQYTIRNHGRTPAIIERLHAQIYIGDNFDAHVPINLADRLDTEMVIADGGGRQFPCFYRGEITPAIVGALFTSRTYDPNKAATKCYLFGLVRYRGIQGFTDEVGFCWEFLVQNDRFYQRDVEGYSYRRLAAEPKIRETL